MKVLEIIHLRLSGEPLETLSDRIKESLEREIEINGERVELYRRDGLSTDLAVHIHHRSIPAVEGPSDLALQLASALRSYGLVEHTLWKEIE